ncbi:MAG: hypothetical protein H3C58_12205 [Fimbriimonadaceae bacterium]|nr:hypothetical protein [Fimbriimonadaceae bacterium]
MTFDDLIAAWRTNNAINLRLLDMCTLADLELKPGKGKTIRSNFVHIVGVRRSWVEESLKAEAATIPKLDWQEATREEILEGLIASSRAMEALLAKREGSAGKSRWSAPLFFGYAVAHEAHHRSQVEIALRLAGRGPGDAALLGLWDWPKISRTFDSES